MSTPPPNDVDVVVPTIGRRGLDVLVSSLLRELGAPTVVHVVDDRRDPVTALPLPDDPRVRVHRSDGRGPAAARNVGWRAARGVTWISFVDDDVVVPQGWGEALHRDLASAPADVGAVTGRVHVPLPHDRPPTDDERQVAGLATAAWVTADMACRHDALVLIDGFDERFRRAYREDTDLVVRLRAAGRAPARGRRHVVHPTRQGPWWSSIARQRGNADDALLLHLHGRARCEAAGAHAGARRRHVVTTACGAAAAAAALSSRRRVSWLAGAWWLARTGAFARRRIVDGPRTAREITAMCATSIAIPPVAVAWWTWGRARTARRLGAGRFSERSSSPAAPRAGARRSTSR